MRLIPSDPDVETIISRIKKNEIDLQPDFQRGEVWSDAKKRRLIDTILREWHVPPIHVIEVPKGGNEEVLDGQQRLVSIRDFANGLIRVDGSLQPHDGRIAQLHGRTYETLPVEWRRRFDRYSIRMFRIVDYQPDEPAELFYRLNQPTNLTAPEQRNAFFGPARQQVKDLVREFEEYGLDKEFIGFSNSRMAYDDVVARLCYSLEQNTLTEKITASNLADRYRSRNVFSTSVIGDARLAIQLLGEARQHIESGAHFNKATLYSWLWFFTRARRLDSSITSPRIIGGYMDAFEALRTPKRAEQHTSRGAHRFALLAQGFVDQLVLIYNDRSSARVADVSSVLSRDIVIWTLFLAHLGTTGLLFQANDSRISALYSELHRQDDLSKLDGESFVNYIVDNYKWGRLA